MAADVLQRLHAQQVLLEQARRQRWEAAFTGWRTLRSHHAISCFCHRVEADMAEPSPRLSLFAQLAASQEEAHKQLRQLCQRVGQLLPPHLSIKAVASWVAAVQQWNEQWQQQLTDRLKELREQEDQLEDEVDQCGVLASAVFRPVSQRCAVVAQGCFSPWSPLH